MEKKKWLGEVVGKEGEDLSRHDEWLCMMYPRLKLLQKLPRTAEMDSKYKNPDKDPPGPWQNTTAFAPGGASHQGMVYAIQQPFTGRLIYPTKDAHWRYQHDQMLEYMCGWCKYELRDLDDAIERATVCGISFAEIRQNLAILGNGAYRRGRKNIASYFRGQGHI